MSVAFRRESDDEHLEPKFELPVPPGPNLVTDRGFALIQARHDEIETLLATDLGEEERKKVLRDARYWRHQLASAQTAPPASGETVAFGTRVSFNRDGRPLTIAIVGHDESDPTTGRIAFSAPLARAMIGTEVGDEVEFADGSIEIIAIVPV